MKTKYVLWIALGMILGNLIFGAVPARAETTSIVADNDTYVYEGNPTKNYDTEQDGGARVVFGNSTADYRTIAYFHFPFTNKPAEFSSAVIKIYYDYVDVTFAINISLVTDNTWKESELTWDTQPAKGALVGYMSLQPPSGTEVITVNVTTKITGTDGISVCLESFDKDLAGYAKALTQENEGDPTLGAYVPILVWTHEPAFPWYYIVIIGLAAAIVVVVIIRKRKSGRSATPGAPKAGPAPEGTPEIKEPPVPQEPSTPPQPPSPPESPGPQRPPPPSESPGPQEPPSL